MGKVPFSLKDVSAQDLLPEGVRFRGRVVAVEQRPKDAEVNAECEVVGKMKDDGVTPVYAGLNVGLAFTEHANNYFPNAKGDLVPLAGRRHYETFSYHPNGPGRRLIAALYDHTGTDREAEYQDLLGKEIDFVLVHKPRFDDPEQKEARIKRLYAPVG